MYLAYFYIAHLIEFLEDNFLCLLLAQHKEGLSFDQRGIIMESMIG